MGLVFRHGCRRSSRLPGHCLLFPELSVLAMASGSAKARAKDGSQRVSSVASGGEDVTELLRSRLQQWWGYPDFRQLQKEAMSLVMQNRDSLIVLPTGGGKSLCYQVPALARDGMAVIVSPLISLMKDQVDTLQSLGIAAACVNSMQTGQEKSEVAGMIRRRALKLLYISPERLVQPKTIEFLRDAYVSFIAVDEAHCISQWGHDFRPEYRQLKTLKREFPGVAVHGYTATATEQVRLDIVEQLGLQNAEVLVGSFDRPNLVYRVERRVDAIGQIQRILERHKGESGIIYCISRRNVEATSQSLNRLGLKTLPYHAGLADEERRKGQDGFIDETADIIVATVAFGMGIDKSNVRFVIHAEMPKSLEHYQQESGRAGRDGLEAECTLLYSPGDVETWNYLMRDVEDEGVRSSSDESLRSMKQYCSSTQCRHRMLVEHFGQTLEKPSCGACDVCLKEMTEVEDALVVSQKILSGVIRQGERFGAGYTAQVLKGSKAKRILENRHDSLSTWGLLKDESETQLKHWIDQLLSQGYLRQSGEFNCLEVTPTGRQVLKGQLTPTLLRVRRTEESERREDSWEGVDRGLFEELRGLRMRLAVTRNLPPYIIFSDATLRALAKHRPTKASSLQQIPGIGAKKLQDFGPVVLFEIQQWCLSRKLPTDVDFLEGRTAIADISERPHSSKPATDSVTAAYYDLFEQELSMEEIAVQLDKSLDTVSRHLASWLQFQRRSDISPWVSVAVQARIEDSIGRLGPEKLKPLFEDLKGEIAYHILRTVATVWEFCQHEEE